MEIKNGLQIHSYDGEGYKPVVDYGSWRVALLNPTINFDVKDITTMQRHVETDEVFVLIAGKCVLFVASDCDEPDGLHGELLEPMKIYNVPKAYWHTHVLRENAKVLIVENRETTAENSPHIKINESLKNQIIEISEGLLN